MSDALNDLHVELLPARTVMSVFSAGGDGGYGGDGGDGGIAISVTAGNVNFGHDQLNASYADASGGAGGSADGGASAAAGDDLNF
jgi:hypothetical protein